MRATKTITLTEDFFVRDEMGNGYFYEPGDELTIEYDDPTLDTVVPSFETPAEDIPAVEVEPTPVEVPDVSDENKIDTPVAIEVKDDKIEIEIPKEALEVAVETPVEPAAEEPADMADVEPEEILIEDPVLATL